MTRKKFDLSGLSKMMDTFIQRMVRIIDDPITNERNEALETCAKHLIEAAAILREHNDEDLYHEISILETVIQMVQDEIID